MDKLIDMITKGQEKKHHEKDNSYLLLGRHMKEHEESREALPCDF